MVEPERVELAFPFAVAELLPAVVDFADLLVAGLAAERRAPAPLLELPARAKLKATATRKGDQIQISAEASEVDKPGENMRLRLVLVEEQVRYTGGNASRLRS